MKDFTGISSPYEAPLAPELVVDTANLSLEQSADAVLTLLCQHGVLQSVRPRA